MKNKYLYCKDCHCKFAFTEKQQLFFKSKKWDNPIRCPTCREKRKQTIRFNNDYLRVLAENFN